MLKRYSQCCGGQSALCHTPSPHMLIPSPIKRSRILVSAGVVIVISVKLYNEICGCDPSRDSDKQLLRQKRLDVLTQADYPLTGTFPADVQGRIEQYAIFVSHPSHLLTYEIHIPIEHRKQHQRINPVQNRDRTQRWVHHLRCKQKIRHDKPNNIHSSNSRLENLKIQRLASCNLGLKANLYYDR